MTKHYTLLSLLLLLISFAGTAQNLPRHLIQVAASGGKHGSGDMEGFVLSAEYLRYTSKKFSINFNLRSSIHNSTHFIEITNTSTGSVTDASIRFTTAGFQAGTDFGWSIIRSRKHELLTSIGGFFRYQSASNGDDGYSIYYPASTGLPVVLVGYNNRTPQQTFALGGIAQIRYNFTFNNKFLAGLNGGLQTDTHGDVITQVGLVFGRRF